MSRNVNGIVFDLDGTLLDTKEVIARSLKDMLREKEQEFSQRSLIMCLNV